MSGNNDESLKQLTDIIRQRDSLGPPAAEVIEPEVRTGVNYPFQSSIRPDIQAGIKRGELLATVVTEWGFDVAIERSDNFHKWLTAFEADLARQTPSGVTYRGTY